MFRIGSDFTLQWRLMGAGLADWRMPDNNPPPALTPTPQPCVHAADTVECGAAAADGSAGGSLDDTQCVPAETPRDPIARRELINMTG